MHRSKPSFSLIQVGLLALATLGWSSCFIIPPVTVDEDEDDMGAAEDMARNPDLSQTVDMPVAADMGNERDFAEPEEMPAMPPDGWDLPSHRRRIALEPIDTFDLPAEDLVVLVRLTPERVAFDALGDDGKGIQFYSDAGVRLDHEIEFFSKQSQTADIWVAFPHEPRGVARIWMYFDTETPANTENPDGLWADYTMVHHFTSLAIGSDLPIDSTGNEKNPSEQQAGLSYGQDALAGLAPNFREAREDYIRFDSDLGLGVDMEDVKTYEFFYKIDQETLAPGIFLPLISDEASCRGMAILLGGDNGDSLQSRIAYATSEPFGCGSDGRGMKSASLPSTLGNRWNHVVMTLDRDNEEFSLWYNGTTTGNGSSTLPAGAFARGGFWELGTSFIPTAGKFVGQIDELRIYDGIRSPETIIILDDIGRDEFLVYGDTEAW